MKKTQKHIRVSETDIGIIHLNDGDFICLTDMLKAKDGEFFISDWLRNVNTVEFLGIWEKINNPNFNYGGYATIRSKAGLNSYKISVKEWIEKTNSIGLRATTGRYGGTYAHKDIAFEFGMWISPEFKIYLIKEFQRLKEQEALRASETWNVRLLEEIGQEEFKHRLSEILSDDFKQKNCNSIIYLQGQLSAFIHSPPPVKVPGVTIIK